MYVRNPNKFKYVTENIIVGRAELHVHEVNGQAVGWALPGGGIIYDRKQAQQFAKRMNALMEYNTLRLRAKQAHRM